jgi:hypothetical protein
MPLTSTVATPVVPLLQIPPEVVLPRVEVKLLQIAKFPVIAETEGKGLTVRVAVVLFAEEHAPLVTTAL